MKVKLNVQFSLRYTDEAIQLFESMEEIRKESKLKRLNSVILLEALLEEKDSFFYNYLCETSIGEVPYRSIINDCEDFYRFIKGKEKNIGKDEKTLNVVISEEGKSVKLILDDDLNDIVDATINETVQRKLNKKLEEFFNSSDESEFETNDTNNFEATYQDYVDDFELEEGVRINDSEEDEQDLNSEILEVEGTIDSVNFLYTLFKLRPAPALEILKSNGVDIDSLEFYALGDDTESEEEDINIDGIPKSLSNFVTSLSDKYKGSKECEILGRDKEETEVMQILQKRGRKNVVLVGKAGVGKSAIAEKLAFDIANGNCPDSLKNHIVLQLNVNDSIAGTMYRGMAEERFQNLVKFLESHRNIILFIDEMHTILGAGSTGDRSDDMANALKPFLASKNAKIIGATTSIEYEQIVSKDPAFKRRFKKLEVKEPNSKEIYPMLKKQISEHEKYHGVTISKKMVDYAILMASIFNNETSNPDRTNDLIDTAMVIAKDHGKKRVDKKSILENFDINFKKYANMDEPYKMATAYHEAGHYLVWRLGGVCKDRKAIAISIMPAEDYFGITVFDDISDEVMVQDDRNYFLYYIAELLAGRLAEKKYTNMITPGAESDLERANKIAYDMICKYGMSSNSKNRIFIDDEHYHMINDNVINQINSGIKDIITEACKIATRIIEENSDILSKLANQLVKKGIMDEKDLDSFFKNNM